MRNIAKWLKNEWLALLGICLVAITICFDLFTHAGTPATFDGPTHITTIDQYYRILQGGEFPVTWLDKFGNYGLPLPLFAHQFTSYLGGLLMFVIQNPVLTFNILVFLSIFFSAALFYVFLRLYFNPIVSFTATIIFSLAPYRILDIYIRGDLPELAAEVFLPIILIGSYLFIQKKHLKGFYILLFSTAFLALAHPLMLMVYAFFIAPYIAYLIIILKEKTKEKVRIVLFTLIAFALGAGIASYYLLPLKIETKYLYYGQSNPFDKNLFLSWVNILQENWQTHIDNGVLTRVQNIQIGLPEILITIIGLVLLIKNVVWDKKRKISLLFVCIFTACLLIFFMLPPSDFIYEHTLLKNFQFPWRMLAIFVFIPPIVLAICLQNVKNKFIYVIIILCILILRVPQLYGKDYIVHPQSSYDFTKENLYPIEYNTIWTGKTDTYPVEKTKPGIIAGQGKIISSNIHNASRTYVVDATTALKMVDYTFYFPGWIVKVDGQEAPIEYQDPHYRGVITYAVPAGQHTITVVYTATKVRQFAAILTFVCFGISIVLLVLRKKMNKLVFISK